MQQMLMKTGGANGMVNEVESKALALLEKRTQLQEKGLNYEQEFLNVFGSLANNFSQNR